MSEFEPFVPIAQNLAEPLDSISSNLLYRQKSQVLLLYGPFDVENAGNFRPGKIDQFWLYWETLVGVKVSATDAVFAIFHTD